MNCKMNFEQNQIMKFNKRIYKDLIKEINKIFEKLGTYGIEINLESDILKVHAIDFKGLDYFDIDFNLNRFVNLNWIDTVFEIDLIVLEHRFSEICNRIYSWNQKEAEKYGYDYEISVDLLSILYKKTYDWICSEKSMNELNDMDFHQFELYCTKVFVAFNNSMYK